MSAQPKPANRYVNERSPFVSAELNADLDSDHPSEDALEWVRIEHERALADPRPRLTSEQVRLNLLARHEARLKRDEAG
jgi:hypothetical protein